MRHRFTMCVLALAIMLAAPAFAQQKFADLVGPVQVSAVRDGALRSPYMTWGADLAFLHANGGLKTKKESVYDAQGLEIEFYQQNDFPSQVRDYMTGATPFLRCTFSMLGPASEVLNSDPRTKPVVFLFLSWSAGDHVVSRENIKTLNDLKRPGHKVRVAVQRGGPHVGWLFDLLATAQLTRDDIEIVFAEELTGPKSAAQKFREDPTVDVCFAISPDMASLTGGVDAKGNGAEGTVKGAHVLVSTQQMARAIPDVMVCRSDYYASHQAQAKKVVAGFLKGADAIVALRKDFEQKKKLSPEYRALLAMMQGAFGKDMLPTLEVDAHGLLMDCVFTGLPGQISFFEDKGNPSGFDAQTKSALDMSQAWGYVQGRSGFDPGHLDYKEIAALAGVPYAQPQPTKNAITGESTALFPDGELDDRTIVSFTISFTEGQENFNQDQYGAEFKRALVQANKFKHAAVLIRGHSDPTQTVVDFLRAGMASGVIKREGSKEKGLAYYLNGKPLDVTQIPSLVQLISGGQFDTVPQGANNPRETLQAALNLSKARADTVRAAVLQAATQQGITGVDPSQFRADGAGISEPVVAKPKNLQEARRNMRVEFRVVKVPAEAVKQEDFEYWRSLWRLVPRYEFYTEGAT